MACATRYKNSLIGASQKCRANPELALLASLESYREFLEGMKQDMEGIRYDIRHTTADEDSVVFSMDVCITKADGSAQHFVAMLLMRFDEHEKVSLWHEVYLPRPQAGAQ